MGLLDPPGLSQAGGDTRYRRASERGVSLSAVPGRLFNVKAQNAEPYSQDSVVTDNGVQYAVWVASPNSNPVIGKRALPHGEWSTFDLGSVAGNPLASPTLGDLHNNYVLGVDTAGYIHVSGNHHKHPLRYLRSTNPGDITSWTAPGMTGTNENSVTYPQFVRLPAGELLFVFRNGESGSGDMFINAYNPATKTWTRRANPLVGTTSNPQQSPYTNHIAVGADGSIHVFFMWRITDDVAQTHDLHHIKSLNSGTTWRTADGTALTLPVVPTTTSTLIRSGNNQMINQNGADVDSQGRPHALLWMFPDSGATTTELHHFWYEAGVGWHDDIEDDFGENFYVATLDLARPMVFCYGARTFAMYCREYDKRRRRWLIKDITPPLSNTARLPEVCVLEADLGLFEPSMDTRAVRERGEYNMLVTPIQPVITGADPFYVSQWGAVMSIDLTRMEMAATVNPPPSRQDDTRWLAAQDLVAAAGNPTWLPTAAFPVYQLDDAVTQALAVSFTTPDSWRRYSAQLWWYQPSTAAGAVVLNTRYATRTPGKSAVAGEIDTGNQTVTAGAQNTLVVTDLAVGLPAMAGNLTRLLLRRIGADAADTLTGSAVVLGVLLRRTR